MSAAQVGIQVQMVSAYPVGNGDGPVSGLRLQLQAGKHQSISRHSYERVRGYLQQLKVGQKPNKAAKMYLFWSADFNTLRPTDAQIQSFFLTLVAHR